MGRKMDFKGKTIVLGITGSIAVYKAVDLASQLTKSGACVNVIMTDAAMEFVTPLTFRNITGRPVVTSLFELASEYNVEHVALADSADAVIISPATANTIAKLALGIADNILTCTVLATKAPVIVAPAMDDNMWNNATTQNNIKKLKSLGVTIIGPESGRLASGRIGKGRFIDIEHIISSVNNLLHKNNDFTGKRIIITAGGTRESIDPVRCITNNSSGKMGYALAEAARDRGADVILITAPTALPRPALVKVIDVVTAKEMLHAVKKMTSKAHVLIMAAAVADFRPARISKNKIKHDALPGMMIKLEKTRDILSTVTGDFLRVGFAAESNAIVANAKNKLMSKKLDLIIANDITLKGSGIGSDNNQVIIVNSNGTVNELPLLPKREVADKILDEVAKLLA